MYRRHRCCMPLVVSMTVLRRLSHRLYANDQASGGPWPQIQHNCCFDNIAFAVHGFDDNHSYMIGS